MARVAIIRWKALWPLALFTGIVALLWWLFADRIAKRSAENLGTRMLGARVEMRRLHLDPLGGKILVSGLVVASPDDSLQNLFEAEELTFDMDVAPLLEKKVIVNRLAANGLVFGTTRTTSGFVPPDERGDTTRSIGDQALEFAQKFDFPALDFAQQALEVGALDPDRLQAVQAAKALGAQADASSALWLARIDSLDPKPTIDSTQALIRRLQGAKPTDVALINAARRQLDDVKRMQTRVGDLEKGARASLDSLQAGARGLDAARRRDYDFARSLVKLPALDPASIAGALFGREAVSRFQKGLYYTQLARAYMPAGLMPQANAAPPRARRDGVDVRFPKTEGLPGFLVREGELSFTLDSESERPRAFAGELRGLTNSPAVYGRPTTFAASAPAVALGAVLDHTGAVPRDSAAGELGGVTLPELTLPDLPLRLAAGKGTVGMSFGLIGDSLRGRWSVHSAAARFVRDSGAPAGSQAQQLIERVLSGVESLDLAAEIGGTISAPRLGIRSNLDDAIARRLREVLGEEIAAAERKLRAQVDGVVDSQVAPVRQRVTALTGDVTGKLADPRQQLDNVKKQLEDEIRRLTRIPGIRLP